MKQGDYGWLFGWAIVAASVLLSMLLCNKFAKIFWKDDGSTGYVRVNDGEETAAGDEYHQQACSENIDEVEEQNKRV